ncbi:MAG: hypothetical protein LBC59_09350 [Chitinispirillales bacterium]|jgi:hypothetical protein|nr:hypothetical protein [Chitinispirillales bacterium]
MSDKTAVTETAVTEKTVSVDVDACDCRLALAVQAASQDAFKIEGVNNLALRRVYSALDCAAEEAHKRYTYVRVTLSISEAEALLRVVEALYNNEDGEFNRMFKTCYTSADGKSKKFVWMVHSELGEWGARLRQAMGVAEDAENELKQRRAFEKIWRKVMFLRCYWTDYFPVRFEEFAKDVGESKKRTEAALRRLYKLGFMRNNVNRVVLTDVGLELEWGLERG